MNPRLLTPWWALLLFLVASLSAQDAPPPSETNLATAETGTVVVDESYKAYVIPVEGAVSPPTLYAIRNGVKAAIEQEFDLVAIDMDTPGGRLDVTLEIMEILNRFPGETITFVNDEATSAGAIIASVTNEIYFTQYGTMGSAEPVTGQGADIDESMKRKLMSFLNSKLDSYTDEYPYRSEVIRAMMDPDFEFKIGEEVISPEGELLNLNARTAHEEYGDPPQTLLGSGIYDDLDTLLKERAEGKQLSVTAFEPTWSLKLAHLIVMAAPFLFTIAMITVYMEFQTPGFGVFGAIGVCCFLIGFFGHNVAGLSGQEPMLLFVIGLLLLAIEVFLMPGTLFFAIPGAIIILVSIVWSMVDIWPENTPDFVWSWDMLVRPLENLMIGGFLGIVAVILMARFLPRSWVWDRLVLKASLAGNARGEVDSQEPVATVDPLIGETATVISELIPSGEIEVKGRRLEARLSYGSAEKGAQVKIVRKTDFGYLVEEVAS